MTQAVNSPSPLAKPQREPYFDNLRAFLIFTVLTGHLIQIIKDTCSNEESAEFLFRWIYSFHMPAFLFLSGLFAKSVFKNGRFKQERLVDLLLVYVVFQVAFYSFEEFVLGNDVHLSFFSPRSGLWYILSMMLYMLCVPLFSKMHPLVPVGLFVVASLLVGVDKDANTYMSFSRFCTMGPFFWAGFGIDPKQIRAFREKKWVPFAGLAALALGTVFLLFTYEQIPIPLFTGKTAYVLIDYPGRGTLESPVLVGALTRTGWYLLAGLMTFGLLALTPKGKMFYSYVGSRTMQIYILQAFLFLSVNEWGIIKAIPIPTWAKTCLILVVGALFTLFFSLKIFEYPFMGFSKLAKWLVQKLTVASKQ